MRASEFGKVQNMQHPAEYPKKKAPTGYFTAEANACGVAAGEHRPHRIGRLHASGWKVAQGSDLGLGCDLAAHGGSVRGNDSLPSAELGCLDLAAHQVAD
jgi:hypothetical protein